MGFHPPAHDFTLPLGIPPAADEVPELGARVLLLGIERTHPIQYPLQLDQQGLDVRHLRKERLETLVLKVAIRLLGFTNREIERRLGYTPSYLTRLFSGQIELRFEHIVDIARAMGLTADEFFAFAYPARNDPPSETAGQLEVLLEELRPSPRPLKTPSSLSGELTEEKLDRRIQTQLEKLFIDWVYKVDKEKVKPPRKRKP